MPMKNVLCWVGTRIGKAISEGLVHASVTTIAELLTKHTQTTEDIQDALAKSYKYALESLEIAIKGPAIWAKTANKEFSLTFESEVMEPFCKGFSSEEELSFRQGCLMDIQKLRKSLPSLWEKLDREQIGDAISLVGGITNRKDVETAREMADVELVLRLQSILGQGSQFLRLLDFRNVLLDAMQFHFMELVKDRERLRTHLDILHKKELAGEIAQERLEVLQALGEIGAKEDLLFGGISQQLQNLCDVAQSIDLNASHIRQDCTDLKTGQLEILCAVELMRKELGDIRSLGVPNDSKEFLELQTHQALLSKDYSSAREGYQRLAETSPDTRSKYLFFAMAAGIFRELRRGGQNFRPLVQEFESAISPSKTIFKNCRFLDFSSRGPLTLRFKVEWDEKDAELVTLSPLLAIRRNPDVRARYLRTPKLLERLSSFHFIPKVLSCDFSVEIPYYITSWIEGQTLAQYLKDKKTEPSETLKLVLGLAQIFKCLHEKEVALRILSIHDIFYTPENQISLHGLEMAKDCEMPDLTQSDAGLSIFSQLPHYSKQSSYSLTPDIAMFGRIFAYICTKTECPQKEQFTNPSLSEIFIKCIEPDTAKRYSSMSEIVEKIQNIYSSGDQPSSKAYVKFESLKGAEPKPNIFYEHDTLVAGRANVTGCRILEDGYASKQHCLLEMNPPLCSVKDIGSRNGTWVNGKKYMKGEGTALKQGDILKIGHTILKVHIFEPQSKPPESADTFFDEHVIYKRERRISQEGIWAIYKAFHPDTHEWVRLKVGEDRGSFSSDRVKRFLEQIKYLERLTHPNIARFYSGGYDGDELYLATEWVEGKTVLDRVQESGAISLPKAKSFMKQLLSALSYAHKEKIVHRSIHPKNLCIGDKEVLKIMDIGLALSFEMLGLAGLSLYNEKEEDILYTAPEQIQDYRKIDLRSDIYAAGAVFFYILTGQPIFDVKDRDPMALVLDYQTPARRLKELIPDIEDPVDKLIARCLEKNLEKRFQKAEEVINILEKI